MKKTILCLVAVLALTCISLPAQGTDIAAVALNATGFLSDISRATVYALDGKAWALSVDPANLTLIKEYREKKAAAMAIKDPKDQDGKVKEINATYGPQFDEAMAKLKADKNKAEADTAVKLGKAVKYEAIAILIDAQALSTLPDMQTAVQAALQNLPKGMAAMKYKNDISYLKYASGVMPNLPGELKSQMDSITTTINQIKAFAAAYKIELPKTESLTAKDTETDGE